MSRRTSEVKKLVEEGRKYPLAEAVALSKKAATAKFDETIEIHIALGIDPKKSDQSVRGIVVLPHGTGKSKRVVVVAKGEKVKEAQDAGADERDQVGCVHHAPPGLGGFDELERHRYASGSRAGALGDALT